MRMVATGKTGQIVTALLERGALSGVEIVLIGRPELDLAHAANAYALLAPFAPDVIVSAAAYTTVDQAETEPALAHAVNCEGPHYLAKAADRIGIPVIHVSTDYVFDGRKTTPYLESDPISPLNVYGASKLAGEQAVALATDNHAILRTAWIYSPFSNNFLKTMLRLAAERPTLSVVNDQFGNPTSALDIADAIIAVARNLIARPDEANLRGIFHLAATGEASRANFASKTFAISKALGGPTAYVRPIATADYPAPAQRPANSRLFSGKLSRTHGIIMPDWKTATAQTIRRLLGTPDCPVRHLHNVGGNGP